MSHTAISSILKIHKIIISIITITYSERKHHNQHDDHNHDLDHEDGQRHFRDDHNHDFDQNRDDDQRHFRDD